MSLPFPAQPPAGLSPSRGVLPPPSPFFFPLPPLPLSLVIIQSRHHPPFPPRTHTPVAHLPVHLARPHPCALCQVTRLVCSDGTGEEMKAQSPLLTHACSSAACNSCSFSLCRFLALMTCIYIRIYICSFLAWGWGFGGGGRVACVKDSAKNTDKSQLLQIQYVGGGGVSPHI